MKRITLIFCLLTILICLSSCGGSKKNCKYAVEIEYGKDNYVQINDFTFFVKKDNKFYVIEKQNLGNPRTSKTHDVTEFIFGKKTD